MTENSQDKKFKWSLVIYTALVAGLCFLGSALFVTCNNKGKVVEKVRHTTDTVVVRKTDKVYVDRVHWLPGKIDTVFVFNGTDSLIVSGYAKDTIYIEKLEMQLVTRDTVIHDTTVIERTVDKQLKHWGVGVSAGFGGFYALNAKKFDAGPYLGLGFTYKF